MKQKFTIETSTESPKWDSFICYSGLYAGLARQLFQALVSKGMKIFFDKTVLMSQDVADTRCFAEQVIHSRSIIILVTKSLVSSTWAVSEIQAALEKWRVGAIKIYPVFITNDLPNDFIRTATPESLATYLSTSFRAYPEIAANWDALTSEEQQDRCCLLHELSGIGGLVYDAREQTELEFAGLVAEQVLHAVGINPLLPELLNVEIYKISKTMTEALHYIIEHFQMRYPAITNENLNEWSRKWATGFGSDYASLNKARRDLKYGVRYLIQQNLLDEMSIDTSLSIVLFLGSLDRANALYHFKFLWRSKSNAHELESIEPAYVKNRWSQDQLFQTLHAKFAANYSDSMLELITAIFQPCQPVENQIPLTLQSRL